VSQHNLKIVQRAFEGPDALRLDMYPTWKSALAAIGSIDMRAQAP
jgi:hypothetical protein